MKITTDVEREADPIAELQRLFSTHGQSSYDEAVSIEEHSLQTAALADAERAGDELIIAALLHDIGHLLQADARGEENFLALDWDHDRVAEMWLRPRFGRRIASAVGGHVDAKRWLCATESEYHDHLSPASVASLVSQGGPFDTDEAIAWYDKPGADEAVRVRRWDDDAKIERLKIAPLSAYVGRLRRMLVDNSACGLG